MNKVLFSLLCAGTLVFSSFASADELTVDVSQAEAIKSTLQALTGKSVSISTGQGDAVTGVVEAVVPDAVKLKELRGKEFYSAVIKLSAVNSVVYRAK